MVDINIKTLEPRTALAEGFPLRETHPPFGKDTTPGREPLRIFCRGGVRDAARPTPIHRADPCCRTEGRL